MSIKNWITGNSKSFRKWKAKQDKRESTYTEYECFDSHLKRAIGGLLVMFSIFYLTLSFLGMAWAHLGRARTSRAKTAVVHNALHVNFSFYSRLGLLKVASILASTHRCTLVFVYAVCSIPYASLFISRFCFQQQQGWLETWVLQLCSGRYHI